MADKTVEQLAAEKAAAIDAASREKQEADVAAREKWEKENPGMPFGGNVIESIPVEEHEAHVIGLQETVRQGKQDLANRANADQAARSREEKKAVPIVGASVTSRTLSQYPRTVTAPNGRSEVVKSAAEETEFLEENAA